MNKVALVTGGATGIGRATSIALAKSGVTVIVGDINEAEAMNTIALIEKDGGKAHFKTLNVGDKKEVNDVVESIYAEYGRLDHAVNNAGIGGAQAPMHELDIESWNHMLAINLTGVFLCLQAELKVMLQMGSGSIVNVASLAGLYGFPGAAGYSVAKHGVISLTKTAASEYGSLNIRVNCVCPGFIETPILKDIPREMLDITANMRVPMKRLGQPHEVGETIAWLLSNQASYVNGHSMIIDGGMYTG